MSANPPRYAAQAEFKKQYLKEGLHVGVLPIDNRLVHLIGLVTVHWGHFEFRFDIVLAAILEAADRVPSDWKTLSFKKRKKLFRDTLKELFSDQPAVIAAFKPILAEASDVQWRRNAVVHGTHRMTLAPKSHLAVFRAESTRNRKPVTLDLNEQTLEPLWHRIAHLSGALKEAVKLIGSVEGFWPTLPDTELLRLFPETSPPTPPKE